MVALARRVLARPKIDEECPDWARALIPFSEQEHEPGVPYDKIPSATIEALEYFFPMPVPPKRQRRIGGKQPGNKYARTCGLAVFLACLPFALAKQLDLFAPGEGKGEVAVLSIRGLSDLAAKVGISYDRVQRWMTILVTLGFIWRFRDGRRTLYVIPLTAYVPRPSAEAVRAKLSALIHSQFYEVEQGGQVVRADRDPELTDLLLETRAKFELHYQLAPSLDLDLVGDPAWENTLADIQQAIPGLTRADLYTILPIVARHLLQERGAGKGRRFVLRRTGTGIESTFSVEATPGRRVTGKQEEKLPRGYEQRSGSADRKRGTTESPCDSPGLHQASKTSPGVAALHACPEEIEAEGRDGKSRFNRETSAAAGSQHSASQASSAVSDVQELDGSNLHLPAGSSPTLCSPAQNERNEDDTAALGQEQSAAQERWKTLAAEVAPIFEDLKSLKFYESVFRSTDERIVRAIFIKTLCQEQNGGFSKSAGAFFKYMWDQWRVYRTYAAARDKWNHWGNRRDPKGIPPDIHDLVTLYAEESYTTIAIKMGHRWPEAEQDEDQHIFLSNVREPSMTLVEAEELVEALLRSASWYLTDPRVCRESEEALESFVVDALWPNGDVCVFASFDEWLDVHRQMLTLPEEIAAWFETERVKHHQDGVSSDDGMNAEEKEDCVHLALARFAFYGWNATSLSWENLVALGRPLLGRPTQCVGEEAAPDGPGSIILEEGQLYVRVNEELVPVDEYQRFDAMGDREEWLEDQEYTEEGQLALLQAQLVLGLHITVLRTCGLSICRTLTALWQGQAERGAVPDTDGVTEQAMDVVVSEETSPAFASAGMLNAEAWQCLQKLLRALEPRFYQIRWRPVGPGSSSVVVESLLSGQSYVYHSAYQIEQALAELSAQEPDEAERI